MNEGLIARRYALAIFKVARKLGAAEEVYGKMKLFEQNFISHPDLQKALMNPVLSPHDKEQLLTTAIGIDPGDLYVRGIRLIIRNHRERYIRSICLMYQKIYRKAYGICRVKIVTAMELEQESLEKIKALVRGESPRQLEFVVETDPELIGGFVVKADSMQLDASVSRELRELRKKLG